MALRTRREGWEGYFDGQGGGREKERGGFGTRCGDAGGGVIDLVGVGRNGGRDVWKNGRAG